ncbi:hypothetical protein [Marinobacterium iners]|uniref:hypothetical protein n=1 Tax=Marinobacterium iners TaxID=48076 RepID=UPI001A906AD6|nr:hypothetical protein [Marinobacterium iners]
MDWWLKANTDEEDAFARILVQTAAAHGDPADWVRGLDTRCAMYRAADVYGATNRYGTISLANAAARAGIEFVGRAHSAAGDAATTALLWRTMSMSMSMSLSLSR